MAILVSYLKTPRVWRYEQFSDAELGTAMARFAELSVKGIDVRLESSAGEKLATIVDSEFAVDQADIEAYIASAPKPA